ncbi:MAG: DUF3108 domain-containing protein [Elusimicrobiota bacterium]|nr:MAG: DUF3108 domain-containing protein [Elusimicrobiota bacterium]
MRLAALALCVALAACASRRRANDPAPTEAASAADAAAAAAPVLVSQSTVPVSTAVTAPEHPPEAAAAARKPASKAPAAGKPVAAKKREWGQIEITTAIISPAQLIGPSVPYSPEYLPLPAFPEKLTFAMSWGLVAVGEATLAVDKIVMFNGRPAYHIVSEAKSNSFCDTFYRVRDLNESWLDARTLTSLGYSKKVREGHFFRDEWVLYDRDAGTFVNRRMHKDGTFNVKTGTIPAQVQDILSSIYYVRVQKLEDGGEVRVNVNTPDNWPLRIKVMKREKARVPSGRFDAVLVEPAMIREGIFVQKGKRLRLWFSDDPKRRLLMMKADVFFGSVTGALREML